MADSRIQSSHLPSHIDVEADARVIKSVADETIQTILNKRAEMDKAGFAHEPLFVGLGEAHSMPAHDLHQLTVLDGLRRAGEPVVMAFENQHDQLLRSYEKEGYQGTIASDAALRQQDYETAGALSLQNFMAFLGAPNADHARKTVMQYCRKTETPSAFTDAAKADDYLNREDPTTKASIEACLGRIPQQDIHDCSPEGLHVRNHHMLRCAHRAVNQYDSRIILQQTGHDHVAGNHSNNDKACDSLLGLSRNFFKSALGFVPLCSGFPEDNLDKHALAEAGADRDLLCRGLPEITAKYDPFTDAPEGEADLQSRAAEAEYLGHVLHAMGLGEHALSIKAYQDQSAADEQDLKERFAAIDRQTSGQPGAKPA